VTAVVVISDATMCGNSGQPLYIVEAHQDGRTTSAFQFCNCLRRAFWRRIEHPRQSVQLPALRTFQRFSEVEITILDKRVVAAQFHVYLPRYSVIRLASAQELVKCSCTRKMP
jgi:hypothetical protein